MRWKWIVLIGVLVIVILITGVYIYLYTYDYNKLKPLVARMVENATGRELHLSGAINLAIGLSPSLVVRDVSFANAAWGSQPQMIKIKKLEAQVRLIPLLFKVVELKRIGFADVDVLLQTDSKGQGNWDFTATGRSDKSSGAFGPVKIEIDSIRIENLHLVFRRGNTGSVERFTVARLDAARQATGDTQTLDLKTEYNGQSVVLSGTTGLIRNLFAHRRFPLQLSGKLATTTVKINGAIEDVLNLQGIDVEIQVTGENLKTLGSVFDIQLPETKSFDAKGDLKGTKDALRLDNIKGSLSGNDIDITGSGSVGHLITLNGVDLQLKSWGKDLTLIGPLIGEELPATDEFEIKGLLTGSTEALSLKEAQASARRGNIHLSLNGAVSDLLNLKGIDLHSAVTGTDLAELGRIIEVKLPATDEFEIKGLLTGSTETLALNEAQGSARRGSMNLTLSGGITQLLALEGIHVALKASGKELAEIGQLIGTELPGLGPFDVSGKISGSAEAISLSELSAVVDQSDFKGLARVEFRKRPKITLRLESSLIDVTALMKTSEKSEQKTDNQNRQKGRLFSDAPLPFNVLRKVDADVLMNARNIRAKDAQFEFGYLTLKLENGDFSIDRLEATYKKTKISGNLHIDPGSPPHLATNFIVQNFDLGNLLKETGVNDQVRAVIDIAAEGKSSGNSVHGLMAELEGSIGAVMGKGYLTKYLDLISLNLSRKVIHYWGRINKGKQIKCAVVQFDIKNGIAESQAFVFDTEAGILTGEGQINLVTEEVSFLLVPEPKHVSLGFSTKLRVTGTLMDAKVRPDNLSLLTKGAEMLSSLAIGPLGLLSPFVHLGAHKKHPCDIKSIGQLGLSVPGKK
jgi:uncharacterized protein involved in outer membrane biogenesis